MNPTLITLIGALSLALTDGVVHENTQCCTCNSMMPKNVPLGNNPQDLPSPFKIVVQDNAYNPMEEIRVDLTATEGAMFRSFMLVAYTYSSRNDKVRNAKGTLTLLDKNYQTKSDCNHRDESGNSFALIGHETTPVSNLRFVWTPAAEYGHIEFRATFVQSDQVFWVREKSMILYDYVLGIPPNPQAFIPPIGTDQCGKTKGCYRQPEGCTEPQCLYILTWTSDAKSVTYELGGLTNGASDSYVAAAMSDDIYVGGDTVLVCAHNMYYGTTEVYVGNHNEDYETTIVPKYDIIPVKDAKNERGTNYYRSIIVAEEGSHQYNRLRCRFTINKDLKHYNEKLQSIRRGPVHLIMSHGYAVDGEPKPMGVGHDEFPHTSEGKVDFTIYNDNHGRASYPLVKAHGCLMILAWVLFSSVGFLLAKYYQTMWPEKRINDRKYWFTGHFQCMAMVFILVIIACILIFVEADGYTKANDLPYRAHPILGIIILVCVLILPLVGLLRPAPGHRCRPVFNWLYWIFATIANVLAIPNIFIGMDFGKSMVPWWATWILVIWVIFHIIVEITLEVHQCMTHKKNKERRKKHELLKRDYPKQHHPVPEPAGRRFKRFMLMLHLIVTILIVLIMIIIIAVS